MDDKLNISPEQAYKILQDTSTLVQEKGATNVLVALSVIMTAIMFLFIIFVFWKFYKNTEKMTNGTLDRLDTLSEKTDRGYIGISDDINGLLEVIRQTKNFEIYHFKMLAPITAENTILRIEEKIVKLVDRNNIGEQLVYIKNEITTLINVEIEEGRKNIAGFDFDKPILLKYFTFTDVIKNSCTQALHELFENAAVALLQLEEGKNNIYTYLLTLSSSQDITKNLRLLDINCDKIKNEYLALKRSINNIADESIRKVKTSIREM